jgi:hypothetical protein
MARALGWRAVISISVISTQISVIGTEHMCGARGTPIFARVRVLLLTDLLITDYFAPPLKCHHLAQLPPISLIVPHW